MMLRWISPNSCLRVVGLSAFLCAVAAVAWPHEATPTSAGSGSDLVDVGLDPGHSSWDVGASSAGLREFEVTLDVTQRVQTLLAERGVSARLSREGNQRVASSVPSDLTEATRVEQFARHAAVAPARAFVSIHFNGHPDRRLRGTETYYNADNHGPASFALATAVHDGTLDALRGVGHAVIDRGVREDLSAGKPYGHFFSLRGPFPSALVEALFLSNELEAAQLRSPAVRDALADGIATGIAKYLTNLTQAEVATGSPQPKPS